MTYAYLQLALFKSKLAQSEIVDKITSALKEDSNNGFSAEPSFVHCMAVSSLLNMEKVGKSEWTMRKKNLLLIYWSCKLGQSKFSKFLRLLLYTFLNLIFQLKQRYLFTFYFHLPYHQSYKVRIVLKKFCDNPSGLFLPLKPKKSHIFTFKSRTDQSEQE